MENLTKMNCIGGSQQNMRYLFKETCIYICLMSGYILEQRQRLGLQSCLILRTSQHSGWTITFQTSILFLSERNSFNSRNGRFLFRAKNICGCNERLKFYL